MRIPLFTIAVVALLLALAVAPNSMANVNKAKVTFSTPVYLGQAPLASSTSPSTSSTTQGPVEMDPQATGQHTKGATAQPGTNSPGPLTTFGIAPGIGSLNVDWNGLNNGDNRNVNPGFDLEPPDQGLCVGNNFVIEPINDVMVFYDNNGNIQNPHGPVSLYDFYLRPRADLLSDPRCYYDTATGRFFITELDFQNYFSNTGGPFRSYLLIAVSNDNNPLHGFGLFSIDTTNDGSDGTPLHFGCPCLPDQPLIGADNFGFYITDNEFGLFGPPGYNDVQIYAMSKQLLEGFVLGTVVLFNNVEDNGTFGTFSIHPATAPDVGGGEPAGGTEYFLAGRDFAGFVSGSLTGVTSVGVWAITNTSTLANVFPSLTLQEKVVSGTVRYNIPPNAKQKGSANQLATDDDRMEKVEFEGGNLQAALSTGNPPVGTGSTYPAIAWFDIHPTIVGGVLGASLVRNGYVVGPTVSGNHTSLMYPALGVNKGNVGIISFSLARPGSGGFFPSTAYIHYKESTGPYGSIQVVGKGVTFENGFTCSPCRWGDYSWAILDDLNPNQMWLATENIDGVTSDSNVNWSTHIAAVPVP